MGVKLSIEIVSPLEHDDREMLTGLSIMVMAIANHELAKEHFPGIFPSPEEAAAQAEREQEQVEREREQVLPCASADGEGRYCVSEVGHKGRHKFRQILPPTPGIN